MNIDELIKHYEERLEILHIRRTDGRGIELIEGFICNLKILKESQDKK